ncbi:uncharacterized protein [Eurosta solidaginis]
MAKTSKRVGRVETNKVKQNNRLKAGGESSSLDSESDADSVSESRDADSEDDDDDDEDEYYNDSDDEESSSTDSSSDENIPRLLSQSAINRISETLGALNTMGHLLVDITRGGQHEPKPETYQASGVGNEVNIASSTVSGISTTSAITTTSTTTAAPSTKFSDVNPTAKILGPPSHESNLVKEQKITNVQTLVKREGGMQTPADPMFVETKDTKKKKKKKKNRNKVKKPETGASNQTQQLNKLPTTMRPSTTTHPTTTHSIDRVDQLPGTTEDVIGKDAENYCKTPNGRPGRCEDLSSCPALLLNLSSLRESLCFKSLFVPGVCCPLPESSTVLTTQRPLKLTTKAPVTVIATKRPTTPRPASSPSLVLIPQLKPSTTTATTTTTPNPLGNELELLGNNNIVDPEECGQQEYSSGRIVGGVEAPNGQWPWMAAIFLHGPKRTEFWCGGSLIGSKYILTAAHCTRDSRQKPFAARQFTVRLGDIDLSTDAEPSAPVTFAVKEVRAHERFPFTHTNAEFRVGGSSSSSPVVTEDDSYVVAIYYNDKYECAGSLITLENVVTVITCMCVEPTMITVKAGAGQGQVRQGKSFLKNDINGMNDMSLGIIQVESPFNRDTVRTIGPCKTALQPGMQMEVKGWSSENGYHICSTVENIAEMDHCLAEFSWQINIFHSTTICGQGANGIKRGASGVVGGSLCAVASYIRNSILYTDISNTKFPHSYIKAKRGPPSKRLTNDIINVCNT